MRKLILLLLCATAIAANSPAMLQSVRLQGHGFMNHLSMHTSDGNWVFVTITSSSYYQGDINSITLDGQPLIEVTQSSGAPLIDPMSGYAVNEYLYFGTKNQESILAVSFNDVGFRHTITMQEMLGPNGK